MICRVINFLTPILLYLDYLYWLITISIYSDFKYRISCFIISLHHIYYIPSHYTPYSQYHEWRKFFHYNKSLESKSLSISSNSVFMSTPTSLTAINTTHDTTTTTDTHININPMNPPNIFNNSIIFSSLWPIEPIFEVLLTYDTYDF